VRCVRKLRIGIVDLVTKGPTRALYARVMHANLASIMPQVVGVWCEAEGHEVTFVCYTGFEDLVAELPADVDLVFIGAFTEAGLLAYALSNLFRSRRISRSTCRCCRTISRSCAKSCAGRASAGTIPTSASASTRCWMRSKRRLRRARSTSLPRAASPCCPSRTSSACDATASRQY